MAARVTRAALGALVVVGGMTGLWAALSPRSFYDGFPGGGRSWVADDGLYNEHLVRDFGNLNLALTVVALVALVTLSRAAVVAAALAWIVFGLPHLVYHVRHLDVYSAGDQVLTITSLVLALALPVVALVADRRRGPAA